MDDDTPTPTSRIGRAVVLLGGITLSALFFWLMVLVLRSPIDGSPLAQWSLRAFSTLMFGALCLLGLSPVASLVRAERSFLALRRFSGRCLGCGLVAEGTRACDRCGHPFEGSDAHWTLPESDLGSLVIGGGVFSAILALGVFMGAYTFDGGSLIGRVALGFLALLISVVGLVGTLGSVLAAFERNPPNAPKLTYARTWTHRDGRRSASVVLVRDGAGFALRGTAWCEANAFTPPDPTAATAFERGLARVIAQRTLDGRLSLRHDRTIAWTARAGAPETPRAHVGGNAYREPAKRRNDGERDEVDAWYLVADREDPSTVLAEFDVTRADWADMDEVGVTSLVRVVCEDSRDTVEARDPGERCFEEPDYAMALRAVMAARHGSDAGR
jgi:hypothetical protein